MPIKPLEKYPPEQIEKINQIFVSIRDLDSNYLRYIETADSLFTLQSWSNAKPFYIEAKNLKTGATHTPAEFKRDRKLKKKK